MTKEMYKEYRSRRKEAKRIISDIMSCTNIEEGAAKCQELKNNANEIVEIKKHF